MRLQITVNILVPQRAASTLLLIIYAWNVYETFRNEKRAVSQFNNIIISK